MKACSKCGEVKPLQDFYRDRQKSDGLRPDCKTCLNASGKRYRETNPEKQAEKNKRWQQQNRDKCASYTQQYRLDHPERALESRRATYQRNPAKHRAASDSWSARHPEQRKAIRRVYRINKRARLKGVSGRFDAKIFDQQFEAQQGRCYWCGISLNESNLHRDHLIPLARGGSNDTSNFVASCADCNRQRRDQLPEEFKGQMHGVNS